MRSILLFLCVLTLSSLAAQNLVPNPSFEDTIQIAGQPSPVNWQTNIGSPDYFSAHYLPPFEGLRTPFNVRGSQTTYDGVAYFGFAVLNRTRLNQREYLQVELNDTLRKDQEYEIEFYLSLADSFNLALQDTSIGVVFKEQLDMGPIDHLVREFRPFYISDSIWDSTDKIGWQKFHYTHKALGGEKVLIIGCFLNDIDVVEINVGGGGNTPFFNSTAYYYIDQISVQWKDTSTSIVETQLQNQLSLYPNPNQGEFQLKYSGNEQLVFSLHSILREEIPFQVRQNPHHFSFQLGNVPRGLYFLSVTSTNGQKHSFKVLVN